MLPPLQSRLKHPETMFFDAQRAERRYSLLVLEVEQTQRFEELGGCAAVAHGLNVLSECSRTPGGG